MKSSLRTLVLTMPGRSYVHGVLTAGVMLAGLGTSGVVSAGQVAFDVPASMAVTEANHLASCDDVGVANGTDRIVELRIPLSVRFDAASEQELLACQFELTCLSGSVTVIDYEPKTTVEAPLNGEVEISKGTQANSSLNLSAAPASDFLHANGSASFGNSSNTSLKYKVAPPVQQLSAAGTIHRATGVYFKLRPSPRRSLEGGQEFVVRLRVRSNWRSDLLLVRCGAVGVGDGGPFSGDKSEVWGRADFQVPLYLAGDGAARSRADQYVASEANFRRMASSVRAGQNGHSPAGLFRQVGTAFDLTGPALPADWSTQLIFRPSDEALGRFARQLPADVKASAERLVTARRSIFDYETGGREVDEQIASDGW